MCYFIGLLLLLYGNVLMLTFVVARAALYGYFMNDLDELLDGRLCCVPGKDGGQRVTVPVGHYTLLDNECDKTALKKTLLQLSSTQVNRGLSAEQMTSFLQDIIDVVPMLPGWKESMPTTTQRMHGALRALGLATFEYFQYCICECGFIYR